MDYNIDHITAIIWIILWLSHSLYCGYYVLYNMVIMDDIMDVMCIILWISRGLLIILLILCALYHRKNIWITL